MIKEASKDSLISFLASLSFSIEGCQIMTQEKKAERFRYELTINIYKWKSHIQK